MNLDLAKKMVDFLNEVRTLDPDLAVELVERRFKCNNQIAAHPTIQVRDDPSSQNGGGLVGILGILNGLCGCYSDGPRKGYGAIAADFDGKENLTGFTLLKNE